MKPTQTIVLLVVAVVLIFAVTFASMYVSQSGPTKKPRKGNTAGLAGLELTFDQVRHPAPDPQDPKRDTFNDELLRVKTEYEKTGQHDFWFRNDNDEEVRVGRSPSCSECPGLELFIAPESWRKVYEEKTESPAAVAAKEERLRHLAAKAERLRELSRDGATVPPHSFGFVRLQWKADRGVKLRPTRSNFIAELWTQDSRWVKHTLEVGALLADGVQIGALLADEVQIGASDITAGIISAGDVARRELQCWSITRSHFDIEIVSTGEPFVRCRKEPLTEQARLQLSERLLKYYRGKGARDLTETERTQLAKCPIVRSGYLLTIEVREQVGKERIDEGQFTHTIHLKTPSDVILLKPLEVAIRGRVRGDIAVTGADNGIKLESFPVRDGTSAEITLQSDRRDVNLHLAEKPDFMTVRLTDPRDTGSGKTWQLALTIPPNKIAGSFPRMDNDKLRDTSIYLIIKVAGVPDRRLRIPVSGDATQ
jgi:hypothetical protein